MKVCVKCRREMRCKENGVLCHFGAGHAYPGDLFECHHCGNQIVIAANGPSHFKQMEMDGQHVINMER